MGHQFVYALTAAVALQIIRASALTCPSDPNCVCGGTIAIELNCNINGQLVTVNLLPDTYLNIKCVNVTNIDYKKLPKCANETNSFNSVTFKDCPLPSTSFKDVLSHIGVSKSMALIYQNSRILTSSFNRKHFAGLPETSKLLLSIKHVKHLPDDLFEDISNLTWLNIRTNGVNLTEELFKPLAKLETLEISHNHMTNISSNLFAHLSFLRKLSLWQSNVTWFSKDIFSGVNVLEELDLSSNELDELPATIFMPLKKLKKLTLFSNKFSALPYNLFRRSRELETVIILNNDVKIKQLPSYLFGNLPNLKLVYIQRCNLEVIPCNLFADSASITNISLAYNDINVLPEAVFNDQINLLELDLSHNKLEVIEEKLFSSLVKLEKLDLSYNSLVEVSGPTFQPLFSLMDINLDHNKIKSITSHLFSNNRQRMIVSMAYNKINLDQKDSKNNSWAQHIESPFAYTYNFRLLNLSHNEFTRVFGDWWMNGYDELDISYNKIASFENKVSGSYTQKASCFDFHVRSVKELRIAHNPLECSCVNFQFLEFKKRYEKTKVVDIELFKCPIYTSEVCNINYLVITLTLAFFILIYTTALVMFVMYKRKEYYNKKKCKYLPRRPSNQTDILVEYCEQDEAFTMKELVPALRLLKDITVYTNQSPNPTDKNLVKNLIFYGQNLTQVVVFTSNYLISNYGHINIKKIHKEMSKAENAVYVFVDIGPENSVYSFLREQRDLRTSLLWGEADFLNKIAITWTIDKTSEEYFDMLEASRKRAKRLPKISKSKLMDYMTVNVDTLTHSHV